MDTGAFPALARFFFNFFGPVASRLRVRFRAARAARPARVPFAVAAAVTVVELILPLVVERLAPFSGFLFVPVPDFDSSSAFCAAGSSKGNGNHFCLPFFFRVRGVFGCDVP